MRWSSQLRTRICPFKCRRDLVVLFSSSVRKCSFFYKSPNQEAAFIMHLQLIASFISTSEILVKLKFWPKDLFWFSILWSEYTFLNQYSTVQYFLITNPCNHYVVRHIEKKSYYQFPFLFLCYSTENETQSLNISIRRSIGWEKGFLEQPNKHIYTHTVHT